MPENRAIEPSCATPATTIEAVEPRSWRDLVTNDAVPFAIALIPLGVLLVITALQSGQHSTTVGDLATQEFRTRAALDFKELLGPYSRYGWSHPGPISFYWAAPFYALSGRQPGGLAMAASAASLAWAAAMLAAIRSAGRRIELWAASAALVVFQVVVGVTWVRHAWNPFQVILPVTAVGVFGATSRAGVRWTLPLVAVAASFAVQTHIGTAPVVAVLLAVTLVPLAWHERRRLRSWLAAAVATVVVTAVLWLPAAVQYLEPDTGNLRLITRFFLDHRGEHQPLGSVLRVVVPQLTMARPNLGGQVASDTASFAPLSPGMLLAAVLLGALVVVGIVRGRRGNPLQTSLGYAAIGGSLASIVATRSATGELLPYFTSFATGVGVLVWISAGTTVMDLVVSAAARSERPNPMVLRGVRGIAAGALCVAASVLCLEALDARSFAATVNNPDVTVMANASQQVLGTPRDRSILVVVGGGRPWPQAAGLALELDRRGYEVHTTALWAEIFGRPTETDGREVDALLVVGVVGKTNADKHFVRPPKGSRRVTQVTGAQVWFTTPEAAERAAKKP